MQGFLYYFATLQAATCQNVASMGPCPSKPVTSKRSRPEKLH